MYETCRAFKYVPTAEALTRSCTYSVGLAFERSDVQIKVATDFKSLKQMVAIPLPNFFFQKEHKQQTNKTHANLHKYLNESRCTLSDDRDLLETRPKVIRFHFTTP